MCTSLNDCFGQTDNLVKRNHFPSRFVHGLSKLVRLLSIHCWLCTMKWDIQKRSLITTWDMIRSNCVHLHVFTWLVKFECFGFAHYPSRFVHCLSRYVYCPSIVDYEMTHREKILDYALAQWNFLITWF